MKATVLVTWLNDARVERTIDSALRQGPVLSEILVADGGSEPMIVRRLAERYGKEPRVRILPVPGSIAESRNAALPHLRTELVAFLDADETAPEGWLGRLSEPIRSGRADFTGGPTRPAENGPKSRAEAYVNRVDAAFFRNAVPNDLALLPMGNSAWTVELLRRIGGFDARLSLGGEDYDVNLRALRSGAQGVFVPEAWVYHDQSHLDSFRKILRRKYRYFLGAALAYLKNGALAERGRASVRRTRIHHPVDLFDLVLKPWALLRARSRYRRTFRP